MQELENNVSLYIVTQDSYLSKQEFNTHIRKEKLRVFVHTNVRTHAHIECHTTDLVRCAHEYMCRCQHFEVCNVTLVHSTLL